MKNKILMFFCALFFALNAIALPIVVTRTTTMGGPNGYAHVTGWDEIVPDAIGNPSFIKQTINCWEPGTDECPAKVFKTTSGSTIEETINNPTILHALEELADKAVFEIDNNNLSGNAFKHICISTNDITICYLVTVKWLSSTNNEGKRMDILTLDYIKIQTP